MTPDVVARFTLGGQTFEDVNPLARSVRTSGPTVAGVRPANAERSTMHAEVGAMLQALDAGWRGGHGELVIEGILCCPWCRGDVKTLARLLGLDSLKVTDADGSVIEFRSQVELLPIRQGGKPWN